MVVIFSELEDRSTSKVIEWLLHYKVPFIRINCDDPDNQPTLHVLIGQLGNIMLEYRGQSYNLSKASAVWFRRGSFKNISTDFFSSFNLPFEIKNQLHRHFYQEQKTLYEFVYKKICHRQINSPLHYIPDKLEILEMARNIGINIPETIVTTQKSEVKKFIDKHQHVVTKNIQDIAILKLGSYIQSHKTNLLTEESFNAMPEHFGYSLFQQAIRKKYELRVFYYNKRFYSIANFSQRNPNSTIDSRALQNNSGALNRLTCFEIPSGLKNKIVQLMSALSMNTGSMDFIVTPQNKIYFLEVNPVGQFDYVGIFGNYQIEKAIAKDFKNLIDGKQHV